MRYDMRRDVEVREGVGRLVGGVGGSDLIPFEAFLGGIVVLCARVKTPLSAKVGLS